MNILFVCTGNTCRSSMAQALAERELKKADTSFVIVKSAGTNTETGLPASENAIIALKSMGIDLMLHRSTVLDKEILKEADLILALADRHLKEVLRILPEAADKAYTLRKYAGLDGDVVDPYGGDLEVYRKTAGELANLVKLSVEKLLKEINGIK